MLQVKYSSDGGEVEGSTQIGLSGRKIILNVEPGRNYTVAVTTYSGNTSSATEKKKVTLRKLTLLS